MKFWSRAVIAAAVFGFALSTLVAYAVATPGPPGAPRNLKATAGDAQAQRPETKRHFARPVRASRE